MATARARLRRIASKLEPQDASRSFRLFGLRMVDTQTLRDDRKCAGTGSIKGHHSRIGADTVGRDEFTPPGVMSTSLL